MRDSRFQSGNLGPCAIHTTLLGSSQISLSNPMFSFCSVIYSVLLAFCLNFILLLLTAQFAPLIGGEFSRIPTSTQVIGRSMGIEMTRPNHTQASPSFRGRSSLVWHDCISLWRPRTKLHKPWEWLQVKRFRIRVVRLRVPVANHAERWSLGFCSSVDTRS